MKKGKRYRFIMLAMLAVFLITACGNSVDPVSQKMVEDINAIGEVTKEDEAQIRKLAENGQIATQYVDLAGNPTSDIAFNPNNSALAIEGITSPDGRIFGKMGHSERFDPDLCKNIPGEKDQKIFESGIAYFL